MQNNKCSLLWISVYAKNIVKYLKLENAAMFLY